MPAQAGNLGSCPPQQPEKPHLRDIRAGSASRNAGTRHVMCAQCRMGVLTDYFSAPSDEAAASALDRVGGPARPGNGPSPLPPFDTFESKNLDPYVIAQADEAARDCDLL